MPLYVRHWLSHFQCITLMCHRFFLVNAAHIMILGAVWKLKQSGKGYGSPTAYDQSRELAAIDASTRVLDFCGQRNAFARKYSILIKDLRQQLSKGLPTAAGDVTSSSSAATRHNSLSSTPNNPSLTGSSASPANSESMAESQVFQNLGGAVNQNSISTSPLPNEDMRQSYHPSVGSWNASIESWSEQFGIFYPTNDVSSYGTLGLILSQMSYILTSKDPTNSLQGFDDLNFLDKMLQ